jgi:hypothetical protein
MPRAASTLVVNLVSADEAAARTPEAEVIEDVVILKAARAQEQAREHADAGESAQVRKVLDEASTELRRLARSRKGRSHCFIDPSEEVQARLATVDGLSHCIRFHLKDASTSGSQPHPRALRAPAQLAELVARPAALWDRYDGARMGHAHLRQSHRGGSRRGWRLAHVGEFAVRGRARRAQCENVAATCERDVVARVSV